MSLRWRWALTLGGATALVALLVLVASGVLTARELRASTDADLNQRVDLLSEGILPGPPRSPFDARRRREVVNLDALYRVIDPEGRVVVESTDAELPLSENALELATSNTTTRVFETVETSQDRYRMVTASIPTDGRGPNLGAVQIAVDVERVEESISSLFTRSTAFGLALIGVAAAVGWLLAGRTVAPLEELTREAERIASTDDLSTSIEGGGADEIGRLAGAFSAMIQSLKGSQEQQQRLVADAGHEFRTPLTALRTNLETLQRRREELTEDQVATLLDAAVSESIELSDLASELVELSQDARSTGEPLTPMSLREVADSVVSKFSTRTDDPIVIRGEGSIVDLRPSQIDRAITNLVGNAVTWNQSGQPIEIVVDGVTLLVRDSGPGIGVADLPYVFDRFYRGDTARTNPGSGLGLSIVRHIVEGHGGTVLARNHPDGGAEVGFSLPG